MTDPLDPPAGRWRYFRSRQVAEARAWAAGGGVAVHENIFKSRGRRTCHLLARDETALVEAAVSVGCSAWWIQRTRTLHFDLVEIYLDRALRRCQLDTARTEAGTGPPSGSDPSRNEEPHRPPPAPPRW